MPRVRIRALLFKQGAWWVAQCLEYDLATAAKRLDDLPAELERFLKVQIAAALEAGLEPFQGLPPAPARFWKRYDEARSHDSAAPQPIQQFRVGTSLEVDATVETAVAA